MITTESVTKDATMTRRRVPSADTAPDARPRRVRDFSRRGLRAAVLVLARMAALFRTVAPVLGVVACLAGCTGKGRPGGAPHWWLEGSGGSGGDGAWTSADQQQRQEEVDAYNIGLYNAQGWELVDSTVTAEGHPIDLIADNAPGAQVALPPPSADIALPDGVERQSTEMDGQEVPWGTIPIYRNSFEPYVSGDSGASSLQNFLDSHQEPGGSHTENRLYAGLISRTPNKGAVGWVNQFEGDVSGGTFSLIEMAVVCRGNGDPDSLQQIGIVASRDRTNFGNAELRLHVEFMTTGSKNYGKDDGGGWDIQQTGFHPVKGARYPLRMGIHGSIVGGREEEARFEIRLVEGKWWVGYNLTWLGYYEAKLFPHMDSGSLDTGACETAWYGEVFDPTPSTWTTTDMGSGRFAEKGRGKAAWIRNPALFLDASAFWTSPPVDLSMGSYDPACYTRTPLAPQPGGELWFFLGGPGGDAPGGACR